MTALEYLWSLPHLPWSLEKPRGGGRPSKSELRRWCRAGSVLINGVLVTEDQAIPNFCEGIWQLIFFPGNAKRQCHVVQRL